MHSRTITPRTQFVTLISHPTPIVSPDAVVFESLSTITLACGSWWGIPRATAAPTAATGSTQTHTANTAVRHARNEVPSPASCTTALCKSPVTPHHGEHTGQAAHHGEKTGQEETQVSGRWVQLRQSAVQDLRAHLHQQGQPSQPHPVAPRTTACQGRQ